MTDRTLDPLDPIRSILTEVTEVLQDDIPTAKVVDQQKIKLTIKPEFARCLTYLFLWTFFILAKVVTMVWVEPILEGGAAALNLPPEQYGCPPFNRVSRVTTTAPQDGLSMIHTLPSKHHLRIFCFCSCPRYRLTGPRNLGEFPYIWIQFWRWVFDGRNTSSRSFRVCQHLHPLGLFAFSRVHGLVLSLF